MHATFLHLHHNPSFSQLAHAHLDATSIQLSLLVFSCNMTLSPLFSTDFQATQACVDNEDGNHELP